MTPSRAGTATLGILACLLCACGSGSDDGPPGPVGEDPAVLGHVPCLDYAAVEEQSDGPYVVPAELFGKHLDLIAKRGFTAMTFADFVAADTPDKLPKKPLLLFAESSAVSVYSRVFPAVQARKLTINLALTCDQLGEPWAMTKAQIDDLLGRGAGLTTLGSAGEPLTGLSDEALRKDLVGCRELLRAKGWTVDQLVYPQGEHDGRVRAFAKQAGFTAGRGTGAADLRGGGYATFAPARRFSIGCAMPVTSTSSEELAAYLDNEAVELEDIYEIKADVGSLGQITRGDFGADHYGHVVLSDEGDTVAFSLYFRRAGTFSLRLRVKAGTKADPDSTRADYAYRFDGARVQQRSEGEPVADPASIQVTWGDQLIDGVTVDGPGVHVLEVKCLRDWSCLLDRLTVDEP